MRLTMERVRALHEWLRENAADMGAVTSMADLARTCANLAADLLDAHAALATERERVEAAEAAARGTLATPTLAVMRALHNLGGCWLVSYDDDATGDPVVTIEYFDGARALAEKEGDNPVRWVAIDRCGRACAQPVAALAGCP